MSLEVHLCWQLGTVQALPADERAVDVLVRRQGLPQWIEVAGVIYTRTQGNAARKLRIKNDAVVRASELPI